MRLMTKYLMVVKQRKKTNVDTKKKEHTAEEVKDQSSVLNSFKLFLLFHLAIFITLIIGYYISPIKAVPFDDWPDVPLKDVYAPNNGLTNGEILNSLNAPESIEVDDNNNIYAGLVTGQIVRLSSKGGVGKGVVEEITSGIIEGIETTDGSDHGRPMGLRLRGKTIYVMDAVYGFYKVNIETKKIDILLRPNDLSPPMKFPNDVDITSNGKFAYITDSSILHPLKRMTDVGLIDGTCTGRLLRYQFDNGQVEIIASDMCFCNSVQLIADDKQIIVSETARSRIVWIDISSGKVLRTVHMPMLPDNIRSSKRGTYWISGANVPSVLAKALVQFPKVRQAIAGILPRKAIMLTMPLAFNSYHNIAVEIDQDGNVLRSLHDPSGEVIFGLSQVTELTDGRLVLGSYFAPQAAIVTI